MTFQQAPQDVNRGKKNWTELPSDLIELNEWASVIGNTEFTDRDRLVNNR